MKWKEHDRWAQKLGIDAEVSREVNNLIDDVEESGLNTEFKEDRMSYILKVVDDPTVAAVAAERICGHDTGRTTKTDSKIYARAKAHFLRQKGDDYVTAYLLHHYLDFLDEKSPTEQNLEALFEEFREKYGHLSSNEVENFLRKHQQDLQL